MLENLKRKIFNKTSDATPLFYVIKELGALPEVLGRDYEGFVQVWKWKIPFHFRQRPMSVAQLNVLVKELNDHSRREEKQMKKAGRKR